MAARRLNFSIIIFLLFTVSCGKGRINIRLNVKSKTDIGTSITSSNLVGSWNGFGGPALDVVVRNSYAYIAKSYKGLEIYDVSDFSNISLVGRYDTAGNAWGVSLSSDGNYAYVADNSNGLVVVDISTPTNPILYSP